jgi:protein-disulfide isomerase
VRPMLTFLTILGVLLLWPGTAAAQTRTCDALSDTQHGTALAVLMSQRPYACCNGTILECLRGRPVCRLATRLANDVCRRAGAGQSREEIERALALRAASMMPGGAVNRIDTSGSAAAGDAAAPVTVVAYACARCSFCARLLPQLHQSVTSGNLQGKVQLFLRPFPIRSHPFSTEADLALVAAERLGRFWPMVLTMYADFDGFEVVKLPDYAVAAGMKRQRFVKAMNARTTREILAKSKREGRRNHVVATPTLFVSGRRYVAELSLPALEDVLEEEYDRVSGREY